MNRILYTAFALLALSMVSCNSGQTAQPEVKDTVEATASVQEAVEQASNGAPIHITKADFLKLVMDYEKNPDQWNFQGDKPCLIDFYADWCAPCRITSPILDQLARDYSGKINVYKVDVDKEQELAAVFGVQSIPTFLFCPVEGKPTISAGIAGSPEATKQMFIQQIEELLLNKKVDSTL
ncbi:MAG: thiol reductase thioredoxin [Bacteroidales bacterium]|nr:thiol reductase thioredoxin [Bacteroidales bacterium]